VSKTGEKNLKGELVIDGRFEWWSKKSEANMIRHGYSFKEIIPIFNDPFFFEMYDRKHSTGYTMNTLEDFIAKCEANGKSYEEIDLTDAPELTEEDFARAKELAGTILHRIARAEDM